MEILDLLYILKYRYDKSHKSFLFIIEDNRLDLYTSFGICSCINNIEDMLYQNPHFREDVPKWPTVKFLLQCHFEMGGDGSLGGYWFEKGELKGRRKLINYAIKKLKKDKMG
jgi:hypothetical protein